MFIGGMEMTLQVWGKLKKSIIIALLILLPAISIAAPPYWVEKNGTVHAYDLITKGPWVDVRSLMDGLSGRPTYATWYANQATTDVAKLANDAAASLTSGGIVKLPKGIYTVKSYLHSPHMIIAQRNNITFEGDGDATVIQTDVAPVTNKAIFGYDTTMTSFTAQTKYLFADQTIGSLSITLSTPAQYSNFSINDYIWISQVNLPPEKGEINQVISINSGTGALGLKYPLVRNYASALGVANVNSIINKNITFKNLKIIHQIPAVSFGQCIGVRFENVTFETAETSNEVPFSFGYMRDVKIINCRSYMPGPSAQALYQIAASTDIEVAGCNLDIHSGTPINVTEGSSNVRIHHNTLHGAGTDSMSVSDSDDVTFDSNDILLNITNQPAINAVLGSNVKFINNKIISLGTYTAAFIGGMGCIFSNNQLIANIGNVSDQGAIGIAGVDPGVNVIGNTITHTNATPNASIVLSSTDHRVNIIGNTIKGVAGQGKGILILDTNGVAGYPGPIILGNYIYGSLYGIYNFSSNDTGMVIEPNYFSGVTTPYYGIVMGINVGDGSWATKPLKMGAYYLWVDATGALRIKSSAPANDTDGTTVGSQ